MDRDDFASAAEDRKRWKEMAVKSSVVCPFDLARL